MAQLKEGSVIKKATGDEVIATVNDITALQLAVAELAEAQADQTANELALAELAEIVLGG